MPGPVIYIDGTGLRFIDPIFPKEVSRLLGQRVADKAAKILRHYGYETIITESIVDTLEAFASRNRALSRCPVYTHAKQCSARLLNAVNKALESIAAIEHRERQWYRLVWIAKGVDPYEKAVAELKEIEADYGTAT